MALISIPSLFFIAQAVLPTPPVSLAVTPAPQRVPTHHARAAATPAPSPQVRITIVNATSVPTIALSTAGTNLPVAYPDFPQGLKTANEPLKTPQIHYVVRGMDGRVVADHPVTFQPVSTQVLLLTGDLSTIGPPDKPPQLGLPPPPGPQPWPPNLQFHLFTSATNSVEGCRYRVFNGMPSKLLIIRTISLPNKPGRQLALLAPGNSALFIRQPPNIAWEAEIDGQITKIAIEQENDKKDCLIPFFLRNGKPDCIRVFEQ